MDARALTDEELKEHLMKYGVTPGPIVASTRMVYEKKLLKLMGQGPSVPPLKQNGTGDLDQYSDSEEEDDFPPEGASARVTESPYLRQTITQQSVRVTSRPSQFQAEAGGDVLSNASTSEMDSPLGIGATRRRPIKGAAGRPVQYRYDDLVTQAVSDRSLGARREAGPSPRLVPIWLQLLLFPVVVIFLLLVYQAMESNQESPFAFMADYGKQAPTSQPDTLESQASPDLSPQAARE